MDAKERLRLYLEQRRELGEEDLVLDQLPVDDVLSILGVAKGKTGLKSKERVAVAPSDAAPSAQADASNQSEPSALPPQAAPPAPPAPRFNANTPASADWRATLRGDNAANAANAANADASADEAKDKAASDAAASALGNTSHKTSAGSDTPDLGLAPVSPAPAWLTALELPAGISVGSARDNAALGEVPDAATALQKIEDTIASCTACMLHTTATHPVPGEGNPNADFVCVGEAPGQNEDESGRPFVGPAGQLLNKILGAIELKREDVFICNVLKHRPPGNRNPLPEEVLACRPYLEQQLSVLKPRVILALGTFAAQTLLNTKQSLGALRGQVHMYFGVPLIVTYHPAALLRNEAWKRPTWQDVQLAQRILDASRAANPS